MLDLQLRHKATRVTFPQCALGANTQKFTILLVTPGLSPKLAHLAELRCTHAYHIRQCGGHKDATGAWTSHFAAAYPPDLNFVIARAIASLRPRASDALNAPPREPTHQPETSHPSDAPHNAPAATSPHVPSPRTEPNATSASEHQPTHDSATSRVATDAANNTPQRTRFQRGLGSSSLRSSHPSSLLVTRRHRPFDIISDGTRGHGCALAASSVNTDPRTRKQAMADDADGWKAAERAEIANHAANGS
eukprot:3876952-Pleurochrysis_carterae.AAC.1